MDEELRRRLFREFVRTHHPDVGGDPATFAAGVSAYRSGSVPAPTGVGSRVETVAPDDPRFGGDVVFRRTRRGPWAVIDEVVRWYQAHRRPPRVQ